MKRILATLISAVPLVLLAAEPALAQSIDLTPFLDLLNGIITAITGPVGIAIGTLAVIGLFIAWQLNFVDFRQALWLLVGIAGVASAPAIVAAIFN